jgi:ADP-ribose pyrophosphatase YjhB (NUDIX family)
LIRETKEEANIDIKEKDVKFISVINRKTWEIEYIDFFYILENYDWKYKNTEPEKCEHLKFFNLNNLPENTVGHVKYILENLDKKNYSVIYWW